MASPSQAHPRRWAILGVLVLSLVVVGLDTLILNVALPTLQRDLGASASDLQWTVDAYSLAFAGLLLLAGGLGDRFGRRLVLFLGLAVFGLASVGAAFVDDIDSLIWLRIAMGVGGALIMPSTLSVIKSVFPAEERARAVSIWAGGAALAIPLGPVLGGLLLEHYHWSSVFLINIPVVVVALIAGAFLVPESRDPSRARLDVIGAVLSAAGLAAIVYALIEAPTHGWASTTTLAWLGGALLVLVAFVAWELRTFRPLLPMSLLADRRVAGSVLTIVFLAFALYGAMFTLTQYLQFVEGHSPLQAGLRLLPVLTLVVAAPLGAVLARWAGLNRSTALGMAVIAGAVGMFATLEVDSTSLAMVGVGLLGMGMGLALPPSSDAILAATPPDKAGVGSSLTEVALQVGGALGVAILGSVLNDRYSDAMTTPAAALPEPAGEAVRDSVAAAASVARQLPGDLGDALLTAARQAFVDGQQASLLLAVGVCLVGVPLAYLLMPRRSEPASASEPTPLPAVEDPADGVADRTRIP